MELEKFADSRREWVERELGLDKMRTFTVSDPWHMPNYKLPEMQPTYAWRVNGDYNTIPSFTFRDINIKTHKYKEDYKEFYDILTYRQDTLGNLIAKKWDRKVAETMTKTLIREEKMDKRIKDLLNWKMGVVDGLENVVVYFRNGKINFEESRNKDMWYVEEINTSYNGDKDSIVLRSISRDNHKFETKINNVLMVEYLEEYNLINDSLFNQKALNVYNNGGNKVNTATEETKKMNLRSNGNMVKRTTDANVSAAKVAATITAGKTLNTLVANKITPQLPYMVKGYADTAIGRVVIANIADFAVKQFMATNPKANMATEAMMQAAMLELADSFDLEGIVSELVDSVALDIPTESE